MASEFRGTINVDIRDSVPDWTPFEPPRAPLARLIAARFGLV